MFVAAGFEAAFVGDFIVLWQFPEQGGATRNRQIRGLFKHLQKSCLVSVNR